MTGARLFLVVAPLVVASQGVVAQEADATPNGARVDAGVTRVQVEALVVDGKGRTAPGLTGDDFELRLGDQRLELATFDVDCPIGATPDPQPLRAGRSDLPAKVGAGVKRRIVFALDYYFLTRSRRPQILKAIESMLRFAKTSEEEVMIVVLAHGVRIEQRFTSDLRRLRSTVTRIGHDASLWARDFPLDGTGEAYFEDLITLLDVLEGYDGSKAVVLFSQAKTIDAEDGDRWYDAVAMHAAAARSAIYPSNPDRFDMDEGGGSEALARFAAQSGGRMRLFNSDVSLPYRQAQRDLSCRYTLGADLDSELGREAKRLTLKVTHRKLKTVHPEMLRLFTDEERQTNRARAAFLDPGPYENPLVRTWTYPLFPGTASAWVTLLTLDFPMPVGSGGADVSIGAEIRRGTVLVDESGGDVHVDPPSGGGALRPVTVFSDTLLRQGDHTLTVVLNRADDGMPVSATSRFQIPPVFEDLLVVRGPIFARAVPGGLLVRANPKERPEHARLDAILGQAKSFEPLIVSTVETSEQLLYYWNACVLGDLDLEGDAIVKRTLMTAEGEVVRSLEDLPLRLAPRPGYENLKCHMELESVAPNTIPPGEYTCEVRITRESGDVIARGSAPLHVSANRP